MIIYKKESAIADRIRNQRSVAYVAGVDLVQHKDLPQMARASVEGINFDTPETSDLHYTRSIFVSTTWNLNSDVFSPVHTWGARNTVVDKPTNIEHDIDNKIGHITSQWAIDSQGNLINDSFNADEVPEHFHICNGAVIYKFWNDKQEEMDQFLQELSEGKYSVSMEVLFNDFDYALRKGDDYHVVSRNSESSFLSAKLRAYGGDGEYDGYEVGRLLKNMNFSGKGYVETPANPESVIFSEDNLSQFSFAKAKNNEFLGKSGVYIPRTSSNNPQTEIEKMSAELVEKQIADLQAELAEAKKVSEQAKAQLEEVNASKFEEKITSLTKELAEANKSNEEFKAAQACMCQKFDVLKAEKEELEKKYDELLSTQVTANRIQVFVEKGYDTEEAKAEVEKLSELGDELFTTVALMVPNKKKKDDKEESKADAVAPESFKTKEESADANEDVEVETEAVAKDESATASVEVEKEGAEEEASEAMVAIASRFNSIFGAKKKENKGE